MIRRLASWALLLGTAVISLEPARATCNFNNSRSEFNKLVEQSWLYDSIEVPHVERLERLKEVEDKEEEKYLMTVMCSDSYNLMKIGEERMALLWELNARCPELDVFNMDGWKDAMAKHAYHVRANNNCEKLGI